MEKLRELAKSYQAISERLLIKEEPFYSYGADYRYCASLIIDSVKRDDIAILVAQLRCNLNRPGIYFNNTRRRRILAVMADTIERAAPTYQCSGCLECWCDGCSPV